ncbi:hypothetical protein [Xanthobacter flavus]|uniref:hypothetical protein n=1 Tax=Xanthobacter flavus TaxID=281 RepID=UPI003729C562
MSALPAAPLRIALRELKGKTAEIASDTPGWERVLTVRDHEGALDPSRPIVIGDRGTGKSFWTGALLNGESRSRLSSVYRRLDLDKVDVELGFGGDEFTSHHPSGNELCDLLRQGFTAEAIWRAVILSVVPSAVRPVEISRGNWRQRVAWIVEDPGLRREFFQVADKYLVGAGRQLLVIFDALDTLSSQWDEISSLMRGLLQVGLFLRPSRALRLKLFLRPDMADDPQLWAVGDSSKLRHDEVMLTWTRRDLHALLIQYLVNHNETRNLIQEYVRNNFGKSLNYESDRYEVPAELLGDEAAQQAFFASVAGDYMGRGATKGRTYTWVPNHLANAKGHAAPRSFLLALGVAAERSEGSAFALEVEGIKEGVRQASQSRMLELREDYRWIDAVFRPLRDMQVPVDRKEIMTRWRGGKIIAAITKEMKADTTGRYLPPPRIASQTDDSATHAALIDTLDHLGIIEVIGDGRLNMPDLFRLAAGVKRMGGVKLRP